MPIYINELLMKFQQIYIYTYISRLIWALMTCIISVLCCLATLIVFPCFLGDRPTHLPLSKLEGPRVATPAGAVFRSGNWEQVDIQVQLGNPGAIWEYSVMKVIFRMIFSTSES